MSEFFENERREAIEAGKQALYSLESAEKNLRKAKNWGLWDMLGNGGLISSLIKRSKMEKAKEDMEQAKRDLSRFSSELRDIANSDSFDIETDDFLSFADWFFDGFFVDWMVQSRINRARKQVSEAIERVRAILDQLTRY